MFFHIYFFQTKCLKNDRTTLTQLNVSEKNPTMFLFAEHKAREMVLDNATDGFLTSAVWTFQPAGMPEKSRKVAC